MQENPLHRRYKETSLVQTRHNQTAEDPQVPEKYRATDSKKPLYVCDDLQIMAEAIAAIKEAAQAYLIGLYEDAIGLQ